MIKKLIISITILLFPGFLSATVYTGNSYYLKTYALPSGTNESSVYSVTVNGQSVQVEDTGDHSYVWFEFAGEINITITVSESVSSYTLSPKSYNISSSKSGADISFSLDRPSHLILHEVNSQTEMLFIFADNLEEDAPTIGGSVVDVTDCGYAIDNTGATDETTDIQDCIDDTSGGGGGTVYFPAGKYKAQDLYVKDNVNIYLAPESRIIWTGSYKYFYVKDLTTTVKVYGRGILAGPMFKIDSTDNVTVQDILIIPNSDGWWAFENEDSNSTTVYNVKIINAWTVGHDGFDHEYGDGVLFDNCFYYGGDDAFVVHAKDQDGTPNIVGVNFRNSVAYTGSSGCKMGTESYNTLNDNMTWENIDLVSYSHSAINLNPGNGAAITDAFFKNIRVEKWTDRSLGNEYVIRLEPWAQTWPQTVSYLDNIDIIRLIDSADQSSNIVGNFADDVTTATTPNERVNDVNIDGWYINDVLVENTTDGNVTTDAYVSNLTFSNSGPPIVTISATQLFAREKLNTGEFTISRSGSTASEITVDYTIRGTATNGTDYQTITSPATLGVGVSSVTITITPIADASDEGIETVFISLDNEVHETYGYILGPDYHAVVNIRDFTSSIHGVSIGGQ